MRRIRLIGLTLILISLIVYVYLSRSSQNEFSDLIIDRGFTRRNAGLVKPWAKINLEEVAIGAKLPTYLTGAKDGSGRMFVVEKPGLIRIIEDGKVISEPFLDIISRVNSRGFEQGLFSVAFHPEFSKNGRLYVNYTDLDGDTVVSEFKVSKSQNKAVEKSERKLLTIDQPAANHNGGQLQFGPDGFLYIGMGDGGVEGDPLGNAQNKKVLLGKMLRIDVEGNPYTVPKTNPFIGEERGLPEVWAYGFRNPWRFSFDSTTGDMYIADVGEDKWEWVHFQPAGSKGGENYGWNMMEGLHYYSFPKGFNKDELTLPIVEYGHDQGCSITGGYVYRGKEFPSIMGTYFFSDFCSGTIWGLRRNDMGTWEYARFLETRLNISSFGEDDKGEIYILDFVKGGIYHLEAVNH